MWEIRQVEFARYLVALRELPYKHGQTSCIDNTNGIHHDLDSTWINSQCYKCHCSSVGMTCCDTIVPPNNPNPKLCTVQYDYDTCQARVVNRDDPSLPC
ncbi:beta-microseminoprotein-like [Silurus asotus]|uniref:Beta-microseminoprotein-like n=1 Tax=Silurus asotus TaxID=30991 RepID=A0AAD5ASI6_SILAS|nr:beta-microseminoprotein-like [Silurus asotus]